MTAECGDGVLGVVELCDKTTLCEVRSLRVTERNASHLR